MTSNIESKYLLPNDSGSLVSDIASGLVGAETINQIGDIKDQIGNVFGDVSSDLKNFTEAVTTEPEKHVEETMDSNQYPNYGYNQSQIMNVMGTNQSNRIGVYGGNTRKMKIVKVPKITRNQKIRKRRQTRKQTRNPRRKQTKRTNKRTRKHRN